MADQTTPIVTTTTSEQFSLNWKDILKGGLVAVLSAVLTVVYTTVQADSLSFDWKAIGITAATTALSYLLKNFFTPSATVIKVQPPVTTTTPTNQ